MGLKLGNLDFEKSWVWIDNRFSQHAKIGSSSTEFVTYALFANKVAGKKSGNCKFC